jgi:hypothetical protein
LTEKLGQLQTQPGGGGTEEVAAVRRDLEDLNASFTKTMRSTGVLGDETRDLARLRNRLADLEAGTYPPNEIDFEDGNAYRDALVDWSRRDSEGRYFDEAERLRRGIASKEASIDHLIARQDRGEPLDSSVGIEEIFTGSGVQPSVPDLEPASGTDRGTVYDRPARELERIAREQDRWLDRYQENFDALAEAKDRIARIEQQARR